MSRLTAASLVGLAVAGFVAWRLGGALGGGVLAGFLLGASLSGLGCLHQRHVLRTRPEHVMQAVAATFALKLVVLVLGGLAFRYLEPAAARVDWRGFLVAYAAAVALVLPFGALDVARSLARPARPIDPVDAGREPVA